MASTSKNSTNENNYSGNEIKDENNIIPGYSTVEEFTKNGFKTLIEATKNANSLPQNREWDFYNAHESFRNLMSSEGDNILKLINNVLKQQGIHGNIKNRDLAEKVELIIEANDIILEKVANNLDELSGLRKKPDLNVEIQAVRAEIPINGSWNKINNAKITVESSLTASTGSVSKSPNSIRLITGKNIQRPQKFFKDKIDNSKAPWEPRIKSKPNNLKPLAIFLENSENDYEQFCHPYEFELNIFEPLPFQLKKTQPVVPKLLKDTPLHFINTFDQLEPLVSKLRGYDEIAIDLEHHSYRSFLGFTCLLQISSPDDDFLIDTMSLRNDLHILNEIFTKPTIVKVFHGADNDILWLQRDLSLYIVNIFDTHLAAKQLNYPHLSLAYLLKRFCKIDADKRFQLADWRLRPLPEELKTYAREDTHYLLYIAQILRNELLEKGENILKAVLTAGKQICLKRFEKPVLHDNSHLELYRKCRKLFDKRQMYALKHLFQWRDETAREEDESPGFVLPNHMLLQISELLPREIQGILACCNPIPPLLRSNLLEIHKIVLKAREQSISKPILQEDSHSRGNTQIIGKVVNFDAVLNCLHDLSKNDEFRDDLPTLLGRSTPENLKNVGSCGFFQGGLLDLEKDQGVLNVFDSSASKDDNGLLGNRKMKKLKFLGPYERYRLVKKYALSEEQQKLKEETNTITDQPKTETEKRTDNERIESLQQHFMTLAANTPQISSNEIPPENTSGEITGQKRKRESSPDLEISKKCPKKKRSRNRNRKSDKTDEKSEEKSNERTVQNGRKRTRNEQRNDNNKRQRNNFDERIKPFDYNSVDFQQFSGGARSVPQTKKLNPKFKSKGPRNKKFDNIGRANIKSSTMKNWGGSRKSW